MTARKNPDVNSSLVLAAALVGGTAQLMSLMPITTYARLGWLATTPETCRPFEPDRFADEMGWEVYPEGLHVSLVRAAVRWG